MKLIMHFMFPLLVFNDQHKNKNKGQQVKCNKMTCEKMEIKNDIIYFNLLHRI